VLRLNMDLNRVVRKWACGPRHGVAMYLRSGVDAMERGLGGR